MTVSNLLFQPSINRAVSKLDDSSSMVSVAVRDGIDSSGRTLMEYKRNSHGGRERLIEELLTMVIWGFGINFLKNKIYDPLAQRFSTIKHPSLDMDLLIHGPQQLDAKTVDAFAQKFPETYGTLRRVVENPALRQKYHVSNVLKFGIATWIPVLLIALGIPTFNQWLTRKKTTAEINPKNTKPEGISQKQSNSATMPHLTIPRLFRNFERQHKVTQAVQPLMQSSPPIPMLGASHEACEKLSPLNKVTGQQPFSFKKIGEANEPALLGSNVSPALRFGFAGAGLQAAMATSKLLQHERYNTLLVDGALSGGRIYKARTWPERVEIIFRESTVVLFLYFAQSFIQRHISRWIDKLRGTDSHLNFQSIKYLRDRYGQNTGQFLSDYQHSLQTLKREIPQLADYLQTVGLAAGEKKSQVTRLERPLVEAIRQYALGEGSDNIILEAAKAAQAIRTLKHSSGKAMLDLTKKVNTEAVLDLTRSLGILAEKAGSNQSPVLEKMLTRSMGSRFTAMMLANAVCAFFLSYAGPKIQHWITFKTTGKKDFPGVEA